MLGFVVTYSLVPLVIDKGLDGTNPLLFNAGLSVGKIIGVTAWIAVTCRAAIFNRDVFRLIRARTFSKAMLLGSTSHFTYALFAWSTTFVDTAVSTIVYETWPVLYMVGLTRLMSHSDGQPRYRKLLVGDYALCAVAFIGLAFVTVGTSSIENNPAGSHVGYQTLGVALSLCAAAVAALNVYNFRWGCDLRRDLPGNVADRGTRDVAELACVMVAFALSSLLVLPASVAAGLATGGGMSAAALLVSVAAGAGLLALGSTCFRCANLQTTDPAINALAYATPVIAVGWLAAFSDIDVADTSYVAVGAVMIVAVNLVLNGTRAVTPNTTQHPRQSTR